MGEIDSALSLVRGVWVIQKSDMLGIMAWVGNGWIGVGWDNLEAIPGAGVDASLRVVFGCCCNRYT